MLRATTQRAFQLMVDVLSIMVIALNMAQLRPSCNNNNNAFGRHGRTYMTFDNGWPGLASSQWDSKSRFETSSAMIDGASTDAECDRPTASGTADVFSH